MTEENEITLINNIVYSDQRLEKKTTQLIWKLQNLQWYILAKYYLVWRESHYRL